MTSLNKLLILAEDPNEFARMLGNTKLQYLDVLVGNESESASRLVPDCNIILGEPPLIREVLPHAARLQWVQSSWAGIDLLCKQGMRRDYFLTGAKGIFGPLISEYVISWVYMMERRVFETRANQSAKKWQPFSYRPSSDIQMGIIGLGSIGRSLARTASHFGIQVSGLNRSGKPCDEVRAVYTEETMSQFLSTADYVVVTLPDTARTRHLIDAKVLEMMKSSAVLINVGRGAVVNESDLVEALREGVIGGAVLDVFEVEPLPLDSPLWTMPNVFITPHNAAESFPEDVIEIFVNNYARFVAGRRLLHLIDFEAGY
jgi:phosphoglycerate dehydrogenase-like enzyme